MAAFRLDLIGRYLRPHRRTVVVGALTLVVVNILSVTIRSIGNICKCKQSFLTFPNSFFYKPQSVIFLKFFSFILHFFDTFSHFS